MKPARNWEIWLSCHMFGGSIEIRLDGVNGQCIGKVDISNTKDEYKTFSTQVKKVKGVHDLYFVFKGGDIQKQNLFFLDWWKFGECKTAINFFIFLYFSFSYNNIFYLRGFAIPDYLSSGT